MTTKPYPALCAECKHSEPEDGSAWSLRCQHPKVNGNDPWALASARKARGTDCRGERERRWFFAVCGINGKAWEPKPLDGNDDAAMLAYATKAVAAQAAEMEALRADAERGRFMIAWAERNGLIDAQFCQPPGAPSGDYYILRGVAIINGNDCAGFGKTPQEAVDAARAALKENP